MKVFNDAFFTNPIVAKKCVNWIKNIKSYTTIIEPSAGDGSFSNIINNCIAYDLEPKSPKIKKQDFLKLEFDEKWGNRVLFVGNPPFGQRSMLAKSFIRHAIELNATTIAFILPDIFSKTTNQKFTLFPKGWHMIDEKKLPDNSFFIIDNVGNKKCYHVPCTFYIWTKDNIEKSKDLRRWPPIIKPEEFEFVNRGNKFADFTLNGNSGKIKNLNEVTNSKSEHYIKVRKGYSIKDVKKALLTLKYNTKSSVNGGNYWLNQDEIIQAWNTQIRRIKF